MTTLLILNDAPYGDERLYNGLRLGLALGKRLGADLKLFLLGDAAAAARRGQKVPNGFYNLGTMVAGVVRAGATVGVCGTCLDARGIAESELVEGAVRSTMDELAEWTTGAEKVLVF